MLPTEDLFVYVYVLIHDLITAGLIAIPRRPGPEPGCSDAELLTIVMVRHLLGRRTGSGRHPDRDPAGCRPAEVPAAGRARVPAPPTG